MDAPHFIHLLMDTDCSQHLVTLNNAAMNTDVEISAASLISLLGGVYTYLGFS